jgi:Ser/Thr protein kinase RdoA (MazF antagonist)
MGRSPSDSTPIPPFTTRSLPPSAASWSGIRVGALLTGGHRNRVWEAESPVGRCVVRESRRSKASLQWELDLLEYLDTQGFVVPLPIRTDEGQTCDENLVVQRWIDGHEPTSPDEWLQVADELVRLHDACTDWPQRPDCESVTALSPSSKSVDADLALLPDNIAQKVLSVFRMFTNERKSVVHGDPGASNLRLLADGRVGFLDWDESRVDVVLHDLSNLGVQVLSEAKHQRAQFLSDAWETINAWTVEPEYARQRFANLLAR